MGKNNPFLSQWHLDMIQKHSETIVDPSYCWHSSLIFVNFLQLIYSVAVIITQKKPVIQTDKKEQKKINFNSFIITIFWC